MVEYAYKNISQNPIDSWSLPIIKLQDINGAVYTQDADASWYFDDYSDEKIISDLNPGIKTKGSKIFEVSTEILNGGILYAFFDADEKILIELNFKGNQINSNDNDFSGQISQGNHVYSDTSLYIEYITMQDKDVIGLCRFSNSLGETEYHILRSADGTFNLNSASNL